MGKLISRLNAIPNSYFEFIDSVVDYAESEEFHYRLVMDYLDNTPSATVSDVLRFVSHQPDFFDDDISDEYHKLVV